VLYRFHAYSHRCLIREGTNLRNTEITVPQSIAHLENTLLVTDEQLCCSSDKPAFFATVLRLSCWVEYSSNREIILVNSAKHNLFNCRKNYRYMIMAPKQYHHRKISSAWLAKLTPEEPNSRKITVRSSSRFGSFVFPSRLRWCCFSQNDFENMLG